MADKKTLNDANLTQADGVKDVPEVLDSADSAEIPLEGAAVGSGGANLPVEPVDQRVIRLESELSQARDQHLRLAAEFDNFRKRVARERVDLADKAQAQFVVKMLEVLDDLERLIGVETSAGEKGAIYDATVLINRKLRKELEIAGLEAVNPTGQAFDPKMHEAVSTVPPPDPSKDHLVAATFQTGYLFKGNLIRPAMVQVYSDQGQP